MYNSYKKNKFKISAQAWYEKFELLEGSYSISDTQDCYIIIKYIIKRHETVSGYPQIRIHVNGI